VPSAPAYNEPTVYFCRYISLYSSFKKENRQIHCRLQIHIT